MSKAPDKRSAMDLRHEVLRKMGLENGFYADGSVALLDAYVAKLNEVWRTVGIMDLAAEFNAAATAILQRKAL